MPPEDIAKFISTRKPIIQDQCFEVWPDNWDTVMFFLGLSTQWRVVAGMGGTQILGLDYQGVEAMMRIKNTPRNAKAPLFIELQIMEREALEVMNKPKDKD